MSPHNSYNTSEEVAEAIRGLKVQLAEQDRTYAERRRVDDERNDVSTRQREELIDRIAKLEGTVVNFGERVDKHGIRQTTYETKFESFFGEQGAFRMVVASGKETKASLDKLLWAILISALGSVGTLLMVILKAH